MLYGPTVTTMLDPSTPLTTTRDRAQGIWPDPVPRPPRPAAVLILCGIWLGSEGTTAELWLPPGIASPLQPGPWQVRTLGPDDQPATVEPDHRLVLRALSEAGGHFLLGAAHSLGNLGLRIALLDPQAGPAIQAARPKADLAPGSDDKRAWLPLSVSSEILAKAASGSANTPLARISAAVSGLAADPRHVALDSRRGMDYHRLRPQSVPHASPKRGVSRAGDGVVTIDFPGPVLDPEADADRVYHLLIEAMEVVRQAMVTIRNDMAKAVRAAGLWYHEPTPRPAAARARKAS
jgi:hypothetical protein